MRINQAHQTVFVALLAGCLFVGCATRMTVDELDARLNRESQTATSQQVVRRVFPIHAQTKMEAWLVQWEAKSDPQSSTPSVQLGNGFRLGERRRVDYVVGGPFPELSEQLVLNGLLLNEGRALRGLRIVLVSPAAPTSELRRAVRERRARLEHRTLD